MKNLMKKLQAKALETCARVDAVLRDDSGDLTTNQLGGWLLGVVIVGLAADAVKATMPGIWTDMMSALKDKLTALW